MNSMLHHAAQLNIEGIELLASNQPECALECFEAALSSVDWEFQSPNPFVNTSVQTASPSPPVALTPLLILESPPTNLKEETVFLLHPPVMCEHQEETTKLLPAYAAALIFNCAVALEQLAEAQQGHKDASQVKACRLYDKFWMLLGRMTQAGILPLVFNCGSFHTVIHRMAKGYHQIGAFGSVNMLLNTLFQMELLQEFESRMNPRVPEVSPAA